MEEIMEGFLKYSSDPYTSISQWKEKNNKKVIGIFPMHIPHEIIHAAGMLPVSVWRGDESVTLAHSHIPPYNCGIARSFIDDVLKVKLSFMDGLICFRQCLPAAAVPFPIEMNAPFPYMEFLYFAAAFYGVKGEYPSQIVLDFLMEDLDRLKEGIEKHFDLKITKEALNNSIEIYNKNRKLLRKLYDLRREKGEILKAREMMAIVHSSMLMPKEEHNVLLERLLTKLESVKPTSNGQHKVILTGGLCQTINYSVLDLIEETNMTVVDDDLYIGSRSFLNDVEVSEDPIRAFADQYFKKTPPCPTKADWKVDWTGYIIDIVKKSDAKGVISVLIKYCPPHLCYYPDITNKLREVDIPEVLLEVEHEIVSLEQTRTRLQSFREIMERT
ncbi:MAG: 2-hydroxyacyl-CoA dehydratase family protein [Thermodesulfobacteriota bacterium]|nr:2-hydroxyacyl-CoA dehydratase family protein [Thermodesulfobacteriota bacterium]